MEGGCQLRLDGLFLRQLSLANLRRKNNKDMKSERIEFILSAVKPPNILNIGCVNHDLPASKEAEQYWLHGQLFARYGGANLLGLDIDESNVRQMREKGFVVDVGDAHKLKYDACFDTVILGELIEHLQSPGACIEGCLRALKPGGRIIITTPNAFSIMLGLMYLKNFDRAFNREHVMWFCPQTLRAFAKRCGLRILSLEFVDELEPDLVSDLAYRSFALAWLGLRRIIPRRYRNTMVAVCEPVELRAGPGPEELFLRGEVKAEILP